jgi:hypothetical protein
MVDIVKGRACTPHSHQASLIFSIMMEHSPKSGRCHSLHSVDSPSSRPVSDEDKKTPALFRGMYCTMYTHPSWQYLPLSTPSQPFWAEIRVVLAPLKMPISFLSGCKSLHPFRLPLSFLSGRKYVHPFKLSLSSLSGRKYVHPFKLSLSFLSGCKYLHPSNCHSPFSLVAMLYVHLD